LINGPIELLRKLSLKERSLAEIVPWMIQAQEDVVICKDGSALVCYEVEGIDIEGVSQIEIDTCANEIEMALREFSPQAIIWNTVHRRRSKIYLDGAIFENEISAYVDDEWMRTHKDGSQFENRHYISILWNPSSGTFKFFDRVTQFQEKGYSLMISILEAAKSMGPGGNSFVFDKSQLNTMLELFLFRLREIESGFSSTGLTRLSGNTLRRFLHNCCSPASEDQDVASSTSWPYLDTYLIDNQVFPLKHQINFTHVRDRFVSAFSVKTLPGQSFPGVLDGLLALRCEVTISQVMQILEDDKAESYITSQEKHLRAQIKSYSTMMREQLFKTEIDQVNTGKLDLANDASDALGELTSERRRYGRYNFVVLCYGETQEELDDAIEQVATALKACDCHALREQDNTLSAWASSIPGQYSEIIRWHHLNIANFADMCHYRTISTGPRLNDYLTQECRRPFPSLTVLPTEYATPYFFNFHFGDLAHAFVVGPSRSGKSIFTNFLVSQFGKYGNVNRFIFDKDFSCMIPTVTQGGQHIDLNGESGSNVKMNPFHLLGDPAHWKWLKSWIVQLISYRGYEITTEDDKTIQNAMNYVRALPEDRWTLRTFQDLIESKILASQLDVWLYEGTLARYFDNKEDSFNLSNFVAIEMGGIFEDAKLAIAFLDYAFYSIWQKLDGTPTLIELEECWFMFSFPHLEEKIKDWIRTAAKKNAFIVFATQSLDEIARSDIFATIIDNVQTRIYLPNPNVDAHYNLYREKFGLTHEQIERIRNSRRKKNYYIVKPGMSRMVECVFPDSILAVMRSNKDAIDTFLRHRKSGAEDWIVKYIEEVAPNA